MAQNIFRLSIFILCSLTMSNLTIAAAKNESSFKGLSYLNGIWYKKELTTVISKPAKNGLHDVTDVLKTRIHSARGDTYLIVFDPGPSDDPSYIVYLLTKTGKTQIGTIEAETLYIPGNGNIYATGRSNRQFNTRLKYKVNGSKFILVKQPMYYVGVKTKTNKALKLYTSKTSKEMVAYLPKGTSVEVMLNDGKSFLVKTPFGLVGWYNPTKTYGIHNYNEAPIKELYYFGD